MPERKDRLHIEKFGVDVFEHVASVDWENTERAASETERVIRGLAENKALMRKLLHAVPSDPYLWSKCEEDVVEDKIVLWDDVDRGLRVRLRISTASQERLAHSHRFSFTNLVLRGRYVHWHYEGADGYDEYTNLDKTRTVCLHEDRAGDCFTIHHSALHSTPFTEVETVSLVLRGNPVKRRAPVMFKETRGRAEALEKLPVPREILEQEPENAAAGTMFWRVGEEDETAERRAQRQLSRAKFDHWCAKLEEWNLV